MTTYLQIGMFCRPLTIASRAAGTRGAVQNGIERRRAGGRPAGGKGAGGHSMFAPGDDLPPGYERLTVEIFRDRVGGPQAYNRLAVAAENGDRQAVCSYGDATRCLIELKDSTPASAHALGAALTARRLEHVAIVQSFDAGLLRRLRWATSSLVVAPLFRRAPSARRLRLVAAFGFPGPQNDPPRRTALKANNRHGRGGHKHRRRAAHEVGEKRELKASSPIV